jgi:hypothetical protein
VPHPYLQSRWKARRGRRRVLFRVPLRFFFHIRLIYASFLKRLLLMDQTRDARSSRQRDTGTCGLTGRREGLASGYKHVQIQIIDSPATKFVCKFVRSLFWPRRGEFCFLLSVSVCVMFLQRLLIYIVRCVTHAWGTVSYLIA